MHEYRSDDFCPIQRRRSCSESPNNKQWTNNEQWQSLRLPMSPWHHKSASATQCFWRQNWPKHSTTPPVDQRWVLPPRRGVCAKFQAFRISPKVAFGRTNKLNDVLEAVSPLFCLSPSQCFKEWGTMDLKTRTKGNRQNQTTQQSTSDHKTTNMMHWGVMQWWWHNSSWRSLQQ